MQMMIRMTKLHYFQSMSVSCCYSFLKTAYCCFSEMTIRKKLKEKMTAKTKKKWRRGLNLQHC